MPPKVFGEGGPSGFTFKPGRPGLSPAETIDYVQALAMETTKGSFEKLHRGLSGVRFPQGSRPRVSWQIQRIRGLTPPVKFKADKGGFVRQKLQSLATQTDTRRMSILQTFTKARRLSHVRLGVNFFLVRRADMFSNSLAF